MKALHGEVKLHLENELWILLGTDAATGLWLEEETLGRKHGVQKSKKENLQRAQSV